MRKKIVGFFVAVFLCGGIHAKPRIELTIDHWKTTNNVPVYFVARDEVPIVDVAVIFSAGSARDGQQWGLASLTAALLDEGTKTKNATVIAEGFDEAGAMFSASASRDFARVDLRTMSNPQYFAPAIKLYSEVLTQPAFNSDAFKRVRQQMLDAIGKDSENPAIVASRQLYRTVYGNQPYGHPVVGTQNSLKALSQDDVVGFYRKFYVDQNAKIIIVGDLSKTAAKQLAENLAAGLQKGQQPPPIPAAHQTERHSEQMLSMPVSQNTIMIGGLGVDYRSPDYFDLLVANYVLGGADFTSILMQTVRQKHGYTYGIYSGFVRLQAGGVFRLVLQVRTDKSRKAQQLVFDTLKTYREHGPTGQQVMDAKANLLGSFPAKLASNASIFENVVLIAVMDLPLDYLQQYPQRVAAVTAASAKAAFAKTVDPESLNAVIVGEKPEAGAVPGVHEKN